MNQVVIKAENLDKVYHLGAIGSNTLSADINRWWARLRGKPDPLLKIGQSNGEAKTLLALNNITFDVKQGEALGIIGKNGAGKSTLLKILSRITAPTSGTVKIQGRIAALLEVGTGFHPELSGRENIFLNGAILGMTKAEIKSKLDEIIDFSGVEKFIDTPVKRYSSGMRVRLAFAVAAHLEPEILIIDEVLAVGDAEFQKKCLGKMRDVSKNEGRTVLFVSHNMNAINRLCKNSIFLENGKISFIGNTNEAITKYLNSNTHEVANSFVQYKENTNELQVLEIGLYNELDKLIKEPIDVYDTFKMRIKYKFRSQINKVHLTFYLRNSAGDVVYFCDRSDTAGAYLKVAPGTYVCDLKIPNPLLVPGKYYFTIGCANADSGINDHKFDVVNLEISGAKLMRGSREGYIYAPLDWHMQQINE